jgi:hypothetical protein
METQSKSRGWPKFSLRGALKRIGVIAKNAKTNKNLVEASANLSKVTATAGVLTATGFITQASFAAAAVVLGSAAIGTTGGTIIPVIGGLVFLSGFLAEKLSMRDNLRVTMILIHKESKRMKHIMDIINKDRDSVKHINFDVYNAMLNELNTFIMSMMTPEQLSDLGITNQKGISSLNRYFSTFVSPGSFMNVLLERLSRTTSAFAIIIAEYTIAKHGKWETPQINTLTMQNPLYTNKAKQVAPEPSETSHEDVTVEQTGGDNDPLHYLQGLVNKMSGVDKDVENAADGAMDLQKAGEVAEMIKDAAEDTHQGHHGQHGGFYTRKRVKKGGYNIL